MSKPKSNKKSVASKWAFVYFFFAAFLLVAAVYGPAIKHGTVDEVSPPSEATILSISDVKYNGVDKAFVINLVANKGGENLIGEITPEDVAALGLTEIPSGPFKIKIFVESVSFDYLLYADEYTSGEDAVLYKIWGSVASEGCLVDRLPYDKVSKSTTESYAKGHAFDGVEISVPSILPRGINDHLPVDYWPKAVEIGEWGYWMPESSSYGGQGECSNEGGAKGDWFVTNLAGTPYAQGYRISTSADIKWKARVVVERSDGSVVSTYLTEDQLASSLGEHGLVKWVGGLVAQSTPPIPAVDYGVIRYVQGIAPNSTKYGASIAPSEFKFVPRYAYEEYKSKLQSIADLDNNYFTFSEEVKPISLSLSRNPSGAVIVGQDVSIIARVYESITRMPAPLAVVYFQASAGTLGATTCITGPTGECAVSFRASAPGSYVINAESYLFGMSSKAVIEMAIAQLVMALSASPTSFTASGSSAVTAELSVGDSVTFSSSGGSLSDSSASFDASGKASTVLSAGSAGSYTVTASATDRYGNRYQKSIAISVGNPPPPVSRDPGVGADYVVATWNGLNNFLAGMIESSDAPDDCALRNGVVTCKGRNDVLYPQFQLVLKASWIGMEVLSGKPQIVEITKPEFSFAGETGIVRVEFQNAGETDGYFDVSGLCPADVSMTNQRVYVARGDTMEASVAYTGAIPALYKCEIRVQSVTDPTASVVEPLGVNIVERPLPEKLEFVKDLPQQIDNLGKTVGETNRMIGILVVLVAWTLFMVVIATILFSFYKLLWPAISSRLAARANR